MHLYQGTTQQFIADATQARLANMLSDRWFDEFARAGCSVSDAV